MDGKRTCHICGKKYSYCPSCPKDATKESWHTLFCSEKCKDIDSILSKYTYNKITSAKAARELTAIEADKIDIARANIKDAIDNIIEANKKPAKQFVKIAPAKAPKAEETADIDPTV